MDSPNPSLEPETESQKPTQGEWLWSEFKFFTKLFAIILVFMTVVWGHYKIPSESMQPTLEVGDHLYVSKYSYGISKHSLPYLLHKLPLPEGRIFSRIPKRGDVVVFRNPNTDVVTIKRVVGLPGDTVQVREGQLYINGDIVKREKASERLYREHKSNRVTRVNVFEQRLPGTEDAFTIYERNDTSLLDDTVAFIMPEETLFFMGDNRDNSVDSRASESGPGMVHMNYVMGRADRIMFSFKKCDRTEALHCPPKKRYMVKL